MTRIQSHTEPRQEHHQQPGPASHRGSLTPCVQTISKTAGSASTCIQGPRSSHHPHGPTPSPLATSPMDYCSRLLPGLLIPILPTPTSLLPLAKMILLKPVTLTFPGSPLLQRKSQTPPAAYRLPQDPHATSRIIPGPFDSTPYFVPAPGFRKSGPVLPVLQTWKRCAPNTHRAHAPPPSSPP